MKKFRFLLVVAIILVSALALCLTAGATTDITAETYEGVYVGEYGTTEVSSNPNVSYTGEAYVIFGKVTGTTEAGIILERYGVSDSTYSTLLESKYFNAREGRITSDGEFGIALYNVADGYYKAKVVAGNYAEPSAEGAYTTFSKGVANYTVDFVIDEDRVMSYEVAAGGTIVPPEVEREGYELAGWRYSDIAVRANASIGGSHRSADYGFTFEASPASFSNINTDRAYVARWVWVGENGDSKAPEVMKLDMGGYSKLSVKHTADEAGSVVEIPAGSVAVMSFDVLEDVATSGATSIGLNDTQSHFWYMAVNADTGATVFVPEHRNGTNYEYNMGTATASTSTIMTPSAVLKEGMSVKLVYKPWEADDNLGWYRAYVKQTGSTGDYTLLAGWETMDSTIATNKQMPALTVGNNAVAAGSLSVPLQNLEIGIDTDGDYTTTADFTDMGIGVAESANDLLTTDGTAYNHNRFVSIDTNYVHSLQYEYRVKMAESEQTSPYAAISFGNVSPSMMNTTDGSYLIMEFTVVESNVDDCTTYAPKFGFGMPHTTMTGNWSQRHGMGAIIGWEADEITGEVLVETDGSDDVDTLVNSYSECDGSYGIGMKDLLTAGTTVRFQVSHDIVDDSTHDGYIYVWYKTAEMADFDVAATVDSIAYNKISQIGGVPTFMSFVQSQMNWRLDMTITGVNCATYTEEGVLTGKYAIQTGTAFNTNMANSVTQVYPAI